MHEIGSRQKSFQKIIFGDVNVVTIPAGKKKTSAQSLTTRKENIEIANENHSRQNSGHLETFEQLSKSEKCLVQKTSSTTSKVDGDVIYAYDTQYDEVISGENEVTLVHNGVTSSDNVINPRCNDLNYTSPSQNELTPLPMPQSKKEKCDNHIKNYGIQTVSSEDDAELHRDNVTTKDKNTISETKQKIDPNNFIAGKIGRVEENNFGNHKTASAEHFFPECSVSGVKITKYIRSCDDLKRKNIHLIDANEDESKSLPERKVYEGWIVLKDDIVRGEPHSEGIQPEEIERKSARKIHDYEIKNIARQEIGLEDDFVLPSEDSPTTSMSMPSNQATESCQPLFVESSLTRDEIKNIGQKIALEDDFVCEEPCREDINLDKKTEAKKKSFLAKNIHSDGIRNIVRQEIGLEDNFVLPSEDFSSTNRNMFSNQATKSFQPLFIEGSLATDEIKNIERQKITLEDDVVRSEDSISLRRCDSPNIKEEKIVSEEDLSSVEDGSNLNKGNALGRRMSKDDDHFGNVNDASNPMVSTEDRSEFRVDQPSSNRDNELQSQDRIHEMEPANEDIIKDPHYQLHTMSDIRYKNQLRLLCFHFTLLTNEFATTF